MSASHCQLHSPLFYHFRFFSNTDTVSLHRPRSFQAHLGTRTEPASPSTSTFVDKLAAETRIQIYEYLLHFDSPLKRSEADAENTSILLTCRKVHDEAIEVFYKTNIICLSYQQLSLAVYDTTNGAKADEKCKKVDRVFEDELVHYCRVNDLPDDTRSSASVNGFSNPTGFIRLIDDLLEGKLPNLRCATLEAESDWATAAALPARFHGKNTWTSYLGLGRLAICNISSRITIVVENKQMIQSWRLCNDFVRDNIPSTVVTEQPALRARPKWMMAISTLLYILSAKETKRPSVMATFLPGLRVLKLDHIDFIGLASDRNNDEARFEKITDMLDEIALLYKPK